MMSLPETCEFYERGLLSYKDFNSAEKRRFRAIIEEYIFPLIALSERDSAKNIFSDVDSISEGAIVSDLSKPGGRQYWEERKGVFPPKFIATVDGYLKVNESS
ncbi:MAG: hypothetical protein ACI9UU_001925 [Candidatus Azotimanducaceae bacterium]|jgi:hypothetical protein